MFARLLALKIAASILLFTGCASTPRTAPRFTEPSTVPIRKAIAAAKSHVEAAQKTIVILQDKCPEAKAEIAAVSTDLAGAVNELQTSEGARIQLQTELTREVAQANQLATNYDKSQLVIQQKNDAIHRRNKLLLTSSILLLTSLAWIFRKPLLMLIGAPFGI